MSYLVNREIGSRFQNIWLKYHRKQIAQYTLTVGNMSGIFLKKNEKKTRLSRVEFNTRLSFRKTIKTINKSLCSCCRDPHFQNIGGIVDIKQDIEKNSRRLKGLKSCGSNSACPVCASKLSSVRGNQLNSFLNVGRENNRSYLMIVVTIPHQKNEPLDFLLNNVIEMCRYIFKQRDFIDFKKMSGCRFVHGGLENMISLKNNQINWHPHKNYILDFDFDFETALKNCGFDNYVDLIWYLSDLMTGLGQKYLNKNKIEKKLLSPFL